MPLSFLLPHAIWILVSNVDQRQTAYIDTGTCVAFPTGIPIDILLGAYDHTHPYNFEGQDDHGITWEPKEDPAVNFG